MTSNPPRLGPTVRRSVPVVIWLITGLFVAAGLVQTAVFPNVRSPDELRHVDLVVQVEQGRAWPWPDPGTSFVSVGTDAGHFLFEDRLPGPQHLTDRVEDAPGSAGHVPPRGERASFDEAGAFETLHDDRDDDGLQEPVLNQLVQHPPLYYVLGAGLLRLVPDWTAAPMDQVWLWLRWLNVLLAAPLPILLWASARRLRLPEPLPVAAALAPLAVPEMSHLLTAVNNDNLLVSLGAALTYLLVRVMTGDLTRRTALLVGLVTTAGMLTKGFALMFPALILLAYGVAALRSRPRWKAAAGSLLVAAAACVPGALWWVRNLVLYGAIQPHGTHTTMPDLTPVYGWSDGGWRWLSRMLERFVTTFFVQDHASARQLDPSVIAAWVVFLGILTAIVFALVRRTIPRATAVVLLAGAPLLGAIVAKGSWEQFAAFANDHAAQQGRYLYTGFAGVALVAIAGTAALPAVWRRRVPAVVLGLALVLHVTFQYDTWNLYWMPRGADGPDAVFRAAAAMAYWYPWNPWILLAVIAAGIATAAGVTWQVVRAARTTDGVGPDNGVGPAAGVGPDAAPEAGTGAPAGPRDATAPHDPLGADPEPAR
ncbi:glycosyltransferase family 39 protein [Myceligenerans crystallogenes]|uniref:Glycosyltransferase RgtA/B/C/D-like domain-containing protein n=1 Tax=Myceligenerans crystallogenes TaxID=316335 RepID=A0ABN2NBF1_9MICO